MKFAFGLMFCFLCHLSYAQERHPEGVGKFQINKTVFDSVGYIVEFPVMTINNSNYLEYYKSYYKKDIPVEIISKELSQGETIKRNQYFINGYRIVYIGHQEISGVPLDNIELLFNDDTLISIKAETTFKAYEALEINYGDPLESSFSETVNCKYKLTGVIEELNQTSHIYTWKYKNVTTALLTYQYFDSDCKKQIIISLDVKDELKCKNYDALTKENEERIKKIEKQNAKEKYKEF